MEISDEELMAFADGALDTQMHASIAARLKVEPELARRLNVFATTGHALGALFDDVMREPVPERLLSAVRRGSPDGQGWLNGTPVRTAGASRWNFGQSALLDALKNFLGSGGGIAVAAVAFALLLALGLSLGLSGQMLRRSGDGDLAATETGLVMREKGRLIASGALRDALETLPSGTRMAVAAPQGASVHTVLSFRNRSGQYCRQYEVGLAGGQLVAGQLIAGQLIAGLACRGDDGAWGVDLQAKAEFNAGSAAAKAKSEGARGEHTTASGTSGVAALEARIDELIEGDAFGREEEAELLKKSWASQPK